MFNVSIATVSRVIVTWANYLFILLSSLKIWISREKVKSSMPLEFQKYCPEVRVILRCTEITSLKSQSETSLSYKDRTTLKGLIGVAPCGLVTFVSPLYEDWISDENIMKTSGVLPLLEPGDEVMADQGFIIDNVLSKVGAKLAVLAFKHSAQFSKKEETLRGISEKVIARVKSFHIWDSPVPRTLTGSLNQIWLNCCVLSSYQGPFSLKRTQ